MQEAKQTIIAETAELLSAELGKFIKFPIEAMPQVLQPLIVQGAKAIQCPQDFIAIPLLVALGAALGRTRMLEVKRGWLESTALWVAVVSRPGTAKSPAFDLATGFLQTLQTELVEQYKHERQAYSVDSKRLETGELKKEPQKPTMKRVVVSDSTVEALALVMDKNPRGVILLRDELAGWVNSLNQYKQKGSDEQFYLSTWSGQSLSIDRKNLDEPITIDNTYLAITGTVQPSVLNKLLSRERHEEGFASRLLIVYPEKMNRKWVDDGIDESLKKPVEKLFRTLYELGFENSKPKVVKFSKEGYRVFSVFMKEHLEQVSRCELDDCLAAYWAKMEGYSARLSLIIHMIRFYAGEADNENVDSKSVSMAATLVNYFKAHIARFYNKLREGKKDDLCKRLVGWAQRHNKNRVSLRDAVTARIAENNEHARVIFDAIEESGLGNWENPNKKKTFVLTCTQHSATQQIQQEQLIVGGTNG